MRYIPPGVTDIQLYGVSKATIHDPDPAYYRYRAMQLLLCQDYNQCFTWRTLALTSLWLVDIYMLRYCVRASASMRFCVCARDIVLQYMWNGRTAVEEPLQLSHPPEQLKADRDLAKDSKGSTGMHLQGSVFSICKNASSSAALFSAHNFLYMALQMLKMPKCF